MNFMLLDAFRLDCFQKRDRLHLGLLRFGFFIPVNIVCVFVFLVLFLLANRQCSRFVQLLVV